ncbi:MAG: DMT family transporter [Leptolyngbyaceae bacterium]|nr:DMT family transporter [Leptolyngbyaceae bacterium]
MLSDFRGELAALAAACIWAVSSTIYAGFGRQLPPTVLNLTKGTVAIAFIILTLWLRGDGWAEIRPSDLWLLMGSGVIGITIGDTVFFSALNCLGARRALLMESLAPPLAAVLALVFLSEVLGWKAYLGIVLTVVGVAWVVVERTPDTHQAKLQLKAGIFFGFIAALCQATGAAMSRAALATTDVSPLWSSLIRITAGAVCLLVWMTWDRPTPKSLDRLRSPKLLVIIAATAFASTFLAIGLQQIALKYTATGIAQALSATSPLFVIPLAAWTGDRITIRAVLGAIVALLGVWILFR